MISKSYRWRKTALASFVTALFGLYGADASALALGRITIQSALGDPLRAEIDIPEINAEEAASLKASVALPDVFRAAGLEYNPALAGMQISLQRRPDGRAFIRLSSDKPVTEPFVDLILEASWSSGRIVRDYTMLLDPPSLRAPVVVAGAPALPQTVPLPTARPPATGTAPAPTSARPAAAPRRAPAPAAAEVAAQPRNNDGNSITVQRGDTASKIAIANKPAQVSLDQMLVALLRANADAFVNGNLNRLKAGAILVIPSEQQALATPAAEAARTVIAQSKDFNDFRGKLATNAPSRQVTAADRKSGGQIQAQVDDKRSAAPAPDKLTLSKGAMQAKAAEERVAQEKMAKDAATRAAELSKNIKDLGGIGAATVPPAAAVAVPASTPTPAPVIAAVPTPIPASAPSAPATPAITSPVAPVPVAPTAPPSVTAASVPKAAAPADQGMVDQLLDSPFVLIGAGALIALLVGLGLYKTRQRRKTADVDSAFLESRLQPDSFFGASGGQRVDTNDGAATGSSMVYSPSQLDAADDVDPVAEADVYLAYGRDLQAEEILKEALRTHAGRIAVHQKLLDIYAKRRDTRAFETMANEAFKLSGEHSQDWARICEQGLTIDPTNPLYHPGGQPATQSQTSALAPRDTPGIAAASTATQKLYVLPAVASAPVPIDLDLDLDFSLDEQPTSAILEAKPSQLEQTVSTVAINPVVSGPAPLDMDFGVTTEALAAPAASAQTLPVEVALPELSLANDTVAVGASEIEVFRQQAEVSFGSTNPVPLQTTHSALTPFTSVDEPLPDVSFGLTSPNPLTTTQPPPSAPAVADSGMLEFDLGTLSLDLDPVVEPSAAALAEPEDRLATKLALADEFVSIGDDDGARALIEEVIAEASGDLKAKAQRALSSLG